MKYNINNNSIDIEYIANGKRNQLKLNNDDHIDMDFFNQLMKAKSNKRDAMCDLFKRKILKEDDEDTVHIQPLKLDKELKPSKYAEKVELQRRKAELEQDKQHIAEEAKVLLKEEAKKKDITALTKEDLNNENDLNKLKEIQARYIEIDKVHKMIINQLDSLEIGSADQVNIKELKNLTVNAFDSINKQLVDAKISEKDKQDIADSVANLIKPNYGQIKHLIDNLKNQIKQLRQNTASSTSSITDSLSVLNDSIDTLSEEIDSIKKELPKSKVIEQLTENLDSLNENLELLRERLAKDSEERPKERKEEQSSEDEDKREENSEEVKKAIDDLSAKITTIEENVDKLPEVFNKKTIDTREQTLKLLAKDAAFSRDLKEKYIYSDDLIKYLHSNLPTFDTSKQDFTYENLLRFFFGTTTALKVNWDRHLPSTIPKQYSHLAFILKYNNHTHLCAVNRPLLDMLVGFSDEYLRFTIDVEGRREKYFTFYGYELEVVKRVKLRVIAKLLTLSKGYNNICVFKDPPLYINIWAGTTTKYLSGDTGQAQYPQLKLYAGDKDLLAFFETRGGNINPDDEKSGKINIDLNQSSTNEKLNEIIRLLSQLNYNVFTTTPMYKQNIQSKKKAKAQGFQTDSEENDDVQIESSAEGVDLYDVLDL